MGTEQHSGGKLDTVLNDSDMEQYMSYFKKQCRLYKNSNLPFSALYKAQLPKIIEICLTLTPYYETEGTNTLYTYSYALASLMFGHKSKIPLHIADLIFARYITNCIDIKLAPQTVDTDETIKINNDYLTNLSAYVGKPYTLENCQYALNFVDRLFLISGEVANE